MINIQSFAKAKDGTSYKATSSGFSNSKNVTTSLDTHNIWGQPFNGTEDVSGNLYNVGSITASGNIQTEGDIIIRQLDEENQVVNDGDLTISVKDKAATFSGKDKYTFDGAIEGTDIKANGNLDVTGASTMNGVTVNGDAAFNKSIEVKGQSKLNDVSSNNITNSDTIKTKNLEVTGSAHFFELIIDKIKAAGGAVLFTPANGFKVDIVESVTDGYKLYWQADDGSGNQADNMWKVNDQALCMSFNQAKEGTNHNISNKYYWSLVTAVSDTNQPVSIKEKKYHYIVISTVTKDGTVNPEIGDTIAMLGYRGTDDKKRQSAIYISAYTSLDKGLTAPLLAQYQGINDFNLESHRKSYFDAVGAKFVGNFEVSNGQTIEDYVNEKLNDVEAAGAPYIGSDGYWYVWDNTLKKYVKTNTKAEGKDGNSINIKGETVGHYRNWATWVKDSSAYIDINEEILLDDSSDWSETNALDGTVYTGFKMPTVMRYVSAPDHNYNAFAASIGDCYIDKDGYLWIATDSQWNNVGKIKGEDGKDGINGTNGTNGTNGKDAEFYKLQPVQELAVVDKNGTLGISLMYNIKHIKGTNEFTVGASNAGYYVRFRPNTSSNYISLSLNTTAPSYTNSSYQTNYHKQSTKIEYLTIQLVSGGLVKDTRVVPVQFAASATLEITDSIKTTVQDNTTSITDLAIKVQTNTNNISSITQKANSIESKVTSNTTTINNLSGSVTSLQSDMSDVKQTASSITSTVSSMKDEIIGENRMLGLNGQGWSNNTIYDDAGNSFHCESTDWFQSHPIEDFNGDYTFSFNLWSTNSGNLQIKILDFTQTYYDDGIYNQYVDFSTYTPCKILTTSSSVSNVTLTNYATSGTSSTWTYTNTETITLAVGDNVAVRVTNNTNSRYNSIYGTVSAINTSSKSVTVKAIALLDQPNTICTLSCPMDKKDGTDINYLHYDEKLGRYWIRFKESRGTAKTFVILFRNLSTSSIGYISRLMLEEGVEYPHKYNSTGQASQSTIKQTANEILMSVNNTYLKIGDGNITLNGDTQVNGALTLTNSDQGFILSGGKGITEIMPKSIGDYQTFQQKSSRTIKTSGNYLAIGGGGSFGSSSTSHITYNWTVRQSLGKLSKGSYIQLTEYGATVRLTNSGTVLGYPNAIFRFYEDGVLKSTLDTVRASSKNPLGSYTTSAEADITVVGVFSYNTTSSDIGWTGGGMIPTATLGVGWTNILPTSAYMLIGYDGIAINFGSNKSAFIGSEAAIFNYGDYQLKISDKGISKQNRRNVYVVRGNGTTSSPITYTVEDPIDTVLCIAINSKVIFPSNPYDGQEIKIFDKSKDNCYVNSNGKYIVSCNDYGTGSVWTNTELRDRVPRLYTYMNGKWYEEYTG